MNVPKKECNLLDAIRRFPALLRELEENKVALGLSGFGLSVTTLEEVFLAVSAAAAAGNGAAQRPGALLTSPVLCQSLQEPKLLRRAPCDVLCDSL